MQRGVSMAMKSLRLTSVVETRRARGDAESYQRPVCFRLCHCRPARWAGNPANGRAYSGQPGLQSRNQRTLVSGRIWAKRPLNVVSGGVAKSPKPKTPPAPVRMIGKNFCRQLVRDSPVSATTSRRWSDYDSGTVRSSVSSGDAVFIHASMIIHASIIITAAVAACAPQMSRARLANGSFACSSLSDEGMKQIGPPRPPIRCRDNLLLGCEFTADGVM